MGHHDSMIFPAKWNEAAGWTPGAVTALAAVVYVLCLPLGWTEGSPLLWDQAGHYLDALRFYRGLAWDDGALLRAALLGADQYPPLHSAALGAWMLVTGPGVAAWLAFGLLLNCITVYLLARAHPVAGVLHVASPLLGGLAPTLMVEPLAGLLLVTAILVFPRADGRWVRATAFGLLTALILLAKYNVGLPLLPAGLVAAALTRRRSALVRTTVVLVVAVAVWALFLGLQDQGWSMFLRFAENRANSQGTPFFGRLAWYGHVLSGLFLPGKAIAVGAALVALAGLRGNNGRRDMEDPRLALAVGYVAFSLAALGRHEYLLARNLTAPVTALLVAVGLALAALPPGRRFAASAVLLLLLILSPLTFSGPYRRDYVQRYYPPGAARLAPLSEACTRQMTRPGRTRVIGTFNEFSPGWVKILALRAEDQNPLSITASCPAPRSRAGIDTTWSPRYAELIEGWAEDDTRRVLAIGVERGSPYDSRDYELWNAWKLNLIRALEESPDFRLAERRELDCGVNFTVFSRTK